MRKLCGIVPVMLAVAVLGATVASSASAAGCEELAKGACLDVVKGLTTKLPVELATRPENKPTLTIVGLGTVTCAALASSTSFEETELGLIVSSFHLTLTGCTFTTNSKCEVHSASAANGTIESIAVTATLPEIKENTGKVGLAPTSGTEFAEIVLGKCEQEAKIKITGSQECKAQKIETELETHELTCTGKESSLKGAGKVAELAAIPILTGLQAEKPVGMAIKLNWY